MEEFEQRLADNPLDVATRLVYADFLEERGDSLMAEWHRKFAELVQKQGDPLIKDIAAVATSLGLGIKFGLVKD